MRHLRLTLPLILVVAAIGGLGKGVFLALLLTFAGAELYCLGRHEQRFPHLNTSRPMLIVVLGLAAAVAGVILLAAAGHSFFAILVPFALTVVGTMTFSVSWHASQHASISPFGQRRVKVLGSLFALVGAALMRSQL